jgi:hypothetical protein
LNVPSTAYEVLEIALMFPELNWLVNVGLYGIFTRFGLNAADEIHRLIASNTATTATNIAHWLRGPRGRPRMLLFDGDFPPGGGVTRQCGDGS